MKWKRYLVYAYISRISPSLCFVEPNTDDLWLFVAEALYELRLLDTDDPGDNLAADPQISHQNKLDLCMVSVP